MNEIRVTGRGRADEGDVAMDLVFVTLRVSSYPAGGVPLAPRDVGLSSIERIHAGPNTYGDVGLLTDAELIDPGEHSGTWAEWPGAEAGGFFLSYSGGRLHLFREVELAPVICEGSGETFTYQETGDDEGWVAEPLGRVKIAPDRPLDLAGNDPASDDPRIRWVVMGRTEVVTGARLDYDVKFRVHGAVA